MMFFIVFAVHLSRFSGKKPSFIYTGFSAPVAVHGCGCALLWPPCRMLRCKWSVRGVFCSFQSICGIVSLFSSSRLPSIRRSLTCRWNRRRSPRAVSAGQRGLQHVSKADPGIMSPRHTQNRHFHILGYVMGIAGGFSSPIRRRSGGAMTNDSGAPAAMMHDQK